MNEGALWQRLADGAVALDVPLTQAQLDAFRRYSDFLLESNRLVNLTALRELPDIIAKLHLDSLSLLKPIAAAAGYDVPTLREQPWRVADVGSGAGVPGLPLLLAWPSLQLSLIEASHKKAKFLTRVIFLLELQASVFCERVETLAQQPSHREHYDLVLARAVAALPTLAELTLPLLRLGGMAALPKGPAVGEEVSESEQALKLLGGELLAVHSLAVPGVSETRTLVLLRKTKSTPPDYPRRPGIPAKRPL